MSKKRDSKLLKTIRRTAKDLNIALNLKKLESMSLVKFDFNSIPEDYAKMVPFKKEQTFVFLGEIRKMDGHGVFVDMKTGKIFCGYHMDEFIELTEDEI